MKNTIYRKCGCGETAFDYTGRRDGQRMVYACRNCRRTVLAPAPVDARVRSVELESAARASGLSLRAIADGFYMIDSLTLITISVSEETYKLQAKFGRRWSTKGRWRKASTVVEKAKLWA